MFAAIRRGLIERFFYFSDKRNSPTNQIRLTQRNLYIFPSKLGFIFLFMLFVLWMIGTNYQNNLVLALVFILLSLFLLGILKTFSNLVGLNISYSKMLPTYAGEEALFCFQVDNPKSRYCDAVEFLWQEGGHPEKVVYSFSAGESSAIQVPYETHKRGILRPGRLLVETYFPLGLFRCWTWIKWDVSSVVFPAPMQTREIESAVIDEEGDGLHPTKGGDDYDGLVGYRPGDSLKLVSWKAFARGKGMYVKEFSQSLSQELWLDFNALPGGLEEKLSALTYWAIQYHQSDENYGLKLPAKSIAPNKGEAHRMSILTELGLF